MSSPAQQARRILVVDDNPDAADCVAQRICERRGASVLIIAPMNAI
jgi:CheY-like chemotaxis protein